MKFTVPKLVDAGAWVHVTDVNIGAKNWRGMRDPRGVVGIVAHHSVTNPKGSWEKEVREIDYIHRRVNGWQGIGYNIIITTEEHNGYAVAVLIGDIASIRAHTTNSKGFKGWKKDAGNWYLIGICMVGQLHINKPTKAQIRTFKAIAEELIFNEDVRFPGLKDWGDLFSHKQFNSTACSGRWNEQREAILKADIGEFIPEKPAHQDKGVTPIYIAVKDGDGYSNIARRAGWTFWDDSKQVITKLKQFNPNHPSFARGNQLWSGDPAFVVGYKDKKQPEPEVVKTTPAAETPVESIPEVTGATDPSKPAGNPPYQIVYLTAANERQVVFYEDRTQAESEFEFYKGKINDGDKIFLYENLEQINFYEKPMEQVPATTYAASGQPHNKWLERKFLVAIVSPIVSVIIKRLGLDAYLNEYVEFVIDMLLWGAPVLWLIIEGQLDKRKIEQQTAVTVENLKLEQAKLLK